MNSKIRYQVGVTFTLEEMYYVELDTDEACYASAEAIAVEMFEDDYSNMPLWAGDTPCATVYEEEEIEDE